MAHRSGLWQVAVAALPLALSGCFDEPPDRENLVFVDALEPGVVYQPFLNSKQDAATVDRTVRYAGDASLRFAVPTPGEPGAGAFNFSGGAITSDLPRDLSSYNALTFWARASRSVTFDAIGLANDNTGASRYQTEVNGLALGPEWTRHVLPIPAPGRLAAERGLLWLAAGAEGSPAAGYQAWFDEIRFETLDASSWNPRPVLTAATRALGPGESYQVEGTRVTYAIDGSDRLVSVFPATFDWQSSNPGAATVSESGLVTATGSGTAVITGSLGGVAAPQTVTITVAAGLSPVAGPPAPTRPQADVISLYSDAYANVPVDNHGADWSNLDAGPRLSEVTLAGDRVHKYTDLLYAGVEFTGTRKIDASAMTHVHVDVWTHSATLFKVKLVDFGADGLFGGGDDSEHELTFDAGTSPALRADQWISLDLPLASFTGLASRAHLAQLVLSASTATVFVDNVYFHR